MIFRLFHTIIANWRKLRVCEKGLAVFVWAVAFSHEPVSKARGFETGKYGEDEAVICVGFGSSDLRLLKTNSVQHLPISGRLEKPDLPHDFGKRNTSWR